MAERPSRKGENEMNSKIKDFFRKYTMVIALVVVFILFCALTDGRLLFAQNMSNLMLQNGYVLVLACGMLLCILTGGNIDLSVGSVICLVGGVAAVLIGNKGFNPFLTILLCLVIGLLVGVWQGYWIGYKRIPPFITTLAGMFIFRGLLNLSLQKTGTIIVPNAGFNALSNGFIPDLPLHIVLFGNKIHFLTLLIGIVAVVLVIMSQIKARKNKQKYNFEVISMPIFIGTLVFVSAIIMVIIYVLAKYQGIPWTAVIVGVILLAYNYMLNKTRLGRYIYGIGGNDQAAELSGVNVRQVTMFAFCSMSVLAALAGILYTSRLQSATPTAGNAFEMDAIASSYIGGVAGIINAKQFINCQFAAGNLAGYRKGSHAYHHPVLLVKLSLLTVLGFVSRSKAVSNSLR